MGKKEEVLLKNCLVRSLGNRNFIKCEIAGNGKINKEDVIIIQNE